MAEVDVGVYEARHDGLVSGVDDGYVRPDGHIRLAADGDNPVALKQRRSVVNQSTLAVD
jgi:O-succinylbenzoate synthase